MPQIAEMGVENLNKLSKRELAIRRRLANNTNATPKMVQDCVDYALRCHNENRGLYAYVMGGKL